MLIYEKAGELGSLAKQSKTLWSPAELCSNNFHRSCQFIAKMKEEKKEKNAPVFHFGPSPPQLIKSECTLLINH